MVTAVSDIVRDAFRMARVIGMGEYPTPDEERDAIRDLQTIVLTLPGMVSWQDVEISEDYTAGENERIRVITTDPVSITVSATVSSARKVIWCCNQIELYCEGYDDRAPKDGARVAISDEYSDSNATYFYRSDIAQWTLATDLTRTSEMPTNADLDRYITALLAAQINPDMTPVTASLVSEGRMRMQRRFDQAIPQTNTYY